MLHYNTFTNAHSNQWVTFVHGAGGSSSIWFKQIREYRKHFNVLLLDLRGHGNSKITDTLKKYTFSLVTKDVIAVLDKENIQKSHFVGISLGTIIIRQLAELTPNRVQSMVMGGAILKLDIRSQVLMSTGNLLKKVVPYLWLYSLFAFIIMPNKNHRESRMLFKNEAKKLEQSEFIKWFRLTAELKPLLRKFRKVDIKIPTLYVMGQQDYLFLPSIQKIVEKHTFTKLLEVKNCGHVVNVEQPTVFNKKTIAYLQKQA